MDQVTKDFLTYDYAEAKDLAKSFLTLIAAILVFSITFFRENNWVSNGIS
jgi:hypothetical protein